MKFTEQELMHRLLVIDLTIRTIERDSRYLESLKLKRVINMWFEKNLLLLKNDLKDVKRQLLKKGIKKQSEEIGKDGFTEYQFLNKGKLVTIRYSNIALRNWVDEEVKRLLDLPYRSIHHDNEVK